MLGYDRVVQDSWHEPQTELRPIRCAFCNSMLFRGAVEKIEIKCSKCGAVQVLLRNGDSWIKERGLSRNRFGKVGYAPNRMVTDSAGRLVAIPDRPRRVVILNTSNLGLYIATGGKPVGRGAGDVLPAVLKDKIKHIPTVGLPSDPDLERIIAMKPDLVIGMAFSAHQSLAAILERKGIPAMLQTFARYSDVLEALRFYGELNGNQELAEKKINAIEQHRQMLIEQIGGRSLPKVLIVWAIAGGLYAALSTSLIGDMVKRLGGMNVSDLLTPMDEKMAYVPLDFKAIASVQPGIILFIDHQFGEMANKGLSALQNPLWQGLDAVRQNRVYCLPYSLFAVNPGAQIEKALSVLASALYREQEGCVR